MEKARTDYDAILERMDIPDLEMLVSSLGTGVLAGQYLYGIVPGDTVRVTASVDYKGPALSDSFYVAIGNRFVYFDEIWSAIVPFSWPSAASFVTKTLVADILITEIGLAPWTPGFFDLYVKIGTGLIPRLMGPELPNVIEVVLKGYFQNFKILNYDKV